MNGSRVVYGYDDDHDDDIGLWRNWIRFSDHWWFDVIEADYIFISFIYLNAIVFMGLFVSGPMGGDQCALRVND